MVCRVITGYQQGVNPRVLRVNPRVSGRGGETPLGFPEPCVYGGTLTIKFTMCIGGEGIRCTTFEESRADVYSRDLWYQWHRALYPQSNCCLLSLGQTLNIYREDVTLGNVRGVIGNIC